MRHRQAKNYEDTTMTDLIGIKLTDVSSTPQLGTGTKTLIQVYKYAQA